MEMKKITRLSMLLALSVVLNIIENIIPIFSESLPGVKLGLANIVILYVLYKYSFKEAITLSILRVFLVSILKTGLFSITFYFSLSGALFSIILMYIIKKTTKLSIIGVSIIGSLFHCFGQLIVLAIYINSFSAFKYMIIMFVFSILTGILTGTIAKEILKDL